MSCPAEADVNVFPAQNRIVAIGDIHGDLAALEYCLRYAADVISNGWQWTGGDTYVVVVGDLIDRYRPGHTYVGPDGWGIGEFVDEEFLILTRLSDLDHQARKHGGRVLKVLGNHEIMNIMDRDFKYVSPQARKLPDRAEKLLRALDRCSVYGVLQIGNWIFAHGGIVETSIPSDKNFYTHVQKSVHRALAKGERKELGPALESVLWDRTWSDRTNVNCSRLDSVFALLVPHLQQLGFRVPAADLRLVVAHSVQSSRTSGYVPAEVIVDLPDVVIFGGRLEKKTDMPQGINSDCNGRLWRVDTGMSRSFDSFDSSSSSSSSSSYSKNTNAILWARRPQVLEILDYGSFPQVAVSKRSLPRPPDVYSAAELAFPREYLESRGYVFEKYP